jgi:hypothetical protein
LRAAYAATDYQVLDGENWLGARLGRTAATIDRLLERLGAASGTFITAWNPRSRPATTAENEAAAAALTADIRARGLRALPHRGLGDDPAWPAEEGWFVLDLDEASGRMLAEAHGQNAIVRIERGRRARLIETRWLRNQMAAERRLNGG